jgi:predicted DNA-binding transcriptional regulator AlpA
MPKKKERPIDVHADLLDADSACAFFGGSRPISKATLYRGIPDRFPPPVRVGLGSSRWVRTECVAARERMLAERDQRAA